MFDPITGGRVRLADTDPWIKVEQDLATYKEEVKPGGGKVIHDDMGQGQVRIDTCVGLVITSALIVDHRGIVKADIDIESGRTFTIDKVGSPDIQPDVTIPIGVRAEVIAREGEIVTADGMDTHIHWIHSQQVQEALISGVTTTIGSGISPAVGTHATTCIPGPWYITRMLQAASTLPVNIDLLGKGNGSDPDVLRKQINAGAIDLKTHEGWGTTPAAIDRALTVADEIDTRVALHSNTLSESGSAEDTLTTIDDRTVHAFHIEDAGDSHAPDIITTCVHPNILPSSINPTLPYIVNTIDEYLDMPMVCRHLDPGIAEDVAFAESRIRRGTIAAEDVLHDIDAFSSTSSDPQMMGRMGEVILRTRQVAHHMRIQRDPLAEEIDDNGNLRVKRYVVKYIINPALAHDIACKVDSVEPDKLANLILWSPAFFDIEPATIVRGRMIVCAPTDDVDASIPTLQPVYYHTVFGVLGATRHHTQLTFISQATGAQNIPQQVSLQSVITIVKGCQAVGKIGMVYNGLQPNITVGAQTYEVCINSELTTSEPTDVLSMARRCFLS